MNQNKNSAMIARLLIGLGIKTYLASGTVMHYVKNTKTSLQQNIKKYSNNEAQMQAAKKAVLSQ